jgi:hypothetical protein
MKFTDLGIDHLKDSTTFKKIQYFSKSNPQKLYSNANEFTLKYKKISDLYLSDAELLTVNNYGLKRQHNYTSQKSALNNSNTLLDSKSVDKMMSYNYGISNSNNSTSENTFKFYNNKSPLPTTTSTIMLNNTLSNATSTKVNLSINSNSSFDEKPSFLNSENDNNQLTNPLKYALNNKWSKKNFLNDK